MGATATYELDTELDKDAQAIYQRSLDMNKVRSRHGDNYLVTCVTPFSAEFYRDTKLEQIMIM